MFLKLTLALALCCAAVPVMAQRADFALTESERSLVIATLVPLDQIQADLDLRYEALHGAAHRAAALLGPSSRHAAGITRVLAEISAPEAGSTKSRVERLRKVLEACRADLAFKPTEEASRPTGFPGFTTVGELEMKHYPKHRLARTTMPNLLGETRGFWTLFQHIKSNEIAMTAPVEMRYDESQGMKPLTMAFLYGDESIGKLGKDGDVEVLDIEPMTVISMGLNGIDREERVEAAGRELEAWLRLHGQTWEAAGSLRVMGWNGPSVRGQKRYFEVQIPLRLKKDV